MEQMRAAAEGHNIACRRQQDEESRALLRELRELHEGAERARLAEQRPAAG